MIELNNISFSYYGHRVLDDVSLSVREGEFCGIIGPNGCGKTTLIRLMSRMISPQSGEISLDGKSYSIIGRRDFAQAISYFPQGRPIPDMTVEELVSYGRFPYSAGRGLSLDDKSAVDSALNESGCSEFRLRNLKELSFGERQRVYMAMLLAQDTRFALLDEPTTYMDVSNQFAMLGILRRVCDGGHSAVAVLHDLPTALKFCDRIIVMNGGKIAFDGTPQSAVASGCISSVFGVGCREVETDGITEYILTPQ